MPDTAGTGPHTTEDKCLLDPSRYRALGDTQGSEGHALITEELQTQQRHKVLAYVVEYGVCSENETDILWREEKITLSWGTVESGKLSLRRWLELGCP